MADRTRIEWTDATWNPVTGCTKVSAGCDHCYAERVTERFHGKGSFAQVVLHPERLDQPLRWSRPRKVFVNSMSDLFHDQVPDEFIAQVFAVMAIASRHTFQVLTKRHARMRSLLSSEGFQQSVWDMWEQAAVERGHVAQIPTEGMLPLPNVWLGVSVENQQWADIRIPALLETPAAVRFLSCEPLLGPVDLKRVPDAPLINGGGVDWVIVGGESGPNARPMQQQWARDIRDQCEKPGVPFLFKQWGEWAPRCTLALCGTPCSCDGGNPSHPTELRRVGKKAAGRDLDGRTWDQYPEVAS